MPYSKRFLTHLEFFARHQPQIAMRLAETEPANPFRENDTSWFSRLHLANTQVVYVFGIGNGSTYKAAQKWLLSNPKHRLIFLEDNLSVLRRYLESPIAFKTLQDPQVCIYGFTDVQGDELLFSNLAWDHALDHYAIAAIPAYASLRSGLYLQLHERLTFEHHRKKEIAQEYLDQGIVFYQNFYANILRLPECHFGDALFGKFRDVPAILCGAGPSLQKQLPRLAQLKDRALIFAGGSSLNALLAHGVTPHFSSGIDPNFAQFKRLRKHANHHIPFFFRSRMHYRALRAIQGPKLYVSGTGGYETSRFFEERLQLPSSDLDEGHNVVNFNVSLARALGCNPIVFVGLDLAYTNMLGYAPGIVPNATVSLQEISTKGIDDAAVLREDIYGKPLYTLWKWIDESHWLSEFAHAHPEITCINATEGGLGMEGIPNIPLHEVVKGRLTKVRRLELRVAKAIQKASLPKNCQRTVRKAMKDLRASLLRCQAHADCYLQQLREDKPSALLSLTQMELEEELAFGAVLCTFQSFIERIQLPEEQRAKTDKQRKALLSKRYRFLRKVAKTQVALIDYAMAHDQD